MLSWSNRLSGDPAPLKFFRQETDGRSFEFIELNPERYKNLKRVFERHFLFVVDSLLADGIIQPDDLAEIAEREKKRDELDFVWETLRSFSELLSQAANVGSSVYESDPIRTSKLRYSDQFSKANVIAKK